MKSWCTCHSDRIFSIWHHKPKTHKLFTFSHFCWLNKLNIINLSRGHPDLCRFAAAATKTLLSLSCLVSQILTPWILGWAAPITFHRNHKEEPLKSAFFITVSLPLLPWYRSLSSAEKAKQLFSKTSAVSILIKIFIISTSCRNKVLTDLNILLFRYNFPYFQL